MATRPELNGTTLSDAYALEMGAQACQMVADAARGQHGVAATTLSFWWHIQRHLLAMADEAGRRPDWLPSHVGVTWNGALHQRPSTDTTSVHDGHRTEHED